MGDVTRIADDRGEDGRVGLDELAREGARRMIAVALEAEVEEYVCSFTDELDEQGHRLVVRNGRGKQRRVTVGAGTLPIRAPRVNDRRVQDETGQRRRFTSYILPRYARRSPKVSDVLPVLYLRGLSTGDFQPALRELLGEDASGLSASSISRLTQAWQDEHAAFKRRRLDFVRYAYLFCDGVHVKVRLGEDKRLCLLVVIGVREDGRKELLAVEDGYRESTDSWADVLRDLKARGMSEPKLLTADGALGLWGALRDIFPKAREQRCWVHKIANALDALPKRVQPRAKGMLHEAMEAPTRAESSRAIDAFVAEFEPRWPKAAEKLTKDRDELLAFYAFPAEHWRHLRTTNPIESSFATVKLRTKVTKGAGSKAAALAMAYKLLDAAQERWRAFNGAELLGDVLDGATFRDGIKVNDDETTTTDERVAA
jgi:transposase-like protein